MKRYPYFLFDFLLLIFILSLLLFAVWHNTISNYALAVASLAVFGVILIGNHGKVLDFDSAITGIKGMRSWRSSFLSLGTLRFDYKGEDVRYSSLIRQRLNGGIPVDYSICMENNSRTSFEAIQKSGRLSMSGNKKFLASVKKEVNAFNRKYGLRGMKNSKGLLEIDVRLEFTASNMKAGGVTRFLKDYLELGYRINKRLKRRR